MNLAEERYTSGLWPELVRFLGDPKIPLDSNGVERALRCSSPEA